MERTQILERTIEHNYQETQSIFHRLAIWLHSLLESTQQKNAIPALDGVRAIACLAVVTFHISYRAQIWGYPILGHYASSIALAGDGGVTLFFILSGFLLFLPYAKSLLFDSSWPSIRLFYLRRMLRILPGYYVSLFLMIFIFHPEFLRVDHLKDLGLFLTFFMDSSQDTYQKINGPFWTLAVEWQFYVWLPFIALGLRFIVQRGSLRRRLWILSLGLFGMIIWGISSRFWGPYLFSHPNLTFLVPRWVINVGLFFLYGCTGIGVHGKFMEDFAVGMIVSFCYILARNLPPGNSFNKTLERLSPWLWGGGILWLFLMALWEASQAVPHHGFIRTLIFNLFDPFHEISLSLGFGSCVLAILFGSIGLKSMFQWTPLRWIGLISYSLYIWHLPLIIQFMDFITPYLNGWGHLAKYGTYWLFALLVVIPFAFLFFVCVERPWMKLSDRLRSKNLKQA